MKLNKIKLFAASLIALSVLAAVFFISNGAGAAAPVQNDAAATYKAKCAMCHGQKAEKAFDASLTDAQHVEIILKGEKKEKPPHMPEFASKGINAEQAQALVVHMRKLKNPEGASGGDDGAGTQSPKEAAKEKTEEISREATVAMYKSKCAACHTAKAEKFFDTSLSESELTRIILKGEKKEKPPHMPAYENQGITEKQAQALAAYMIELRTPAK